MSIKVEMTMSETTNYLKANQSQIQISRPTFTLKLIISPAKYSFKGVNLRVKNIDKIRHILHHSRPTLCIDDYSFRI